jgi:UDP-N-acetylglucosamine--N-acetylmuramyl-(pentapeptide) pyrophosphoryl-undecaprenol N-acetylglucosamine transferase
MAKELKRVIFAGGGTGGHLYPAVAIGTYLRKNYGVQIAFVGNRHSFEERKLSELGEKFFAIRSVALKRGKILVNLLLPFRLMYSIWQSLRVIRSFQPQAVVGTGGYVSAPPMLAAFLQRIPFALQEQNSFPGITTRLLSRFARYIFTGFEEAKQFLPLSKCIHTGNPVRMEFASSIKTSQQRDGRGELQLLVFGGSQGALSINNMMLDTVDHLLQQFSHLRILWQTGERGLADLMTRFGDADRVEMVGFIETMHKALDDADLIACRAGALSLAEIALAGRAAILIPYPHAAGDHQLHNARTMEAAGAARCLPEGSDLAVRFLAVAQDLLAHPEKRENMATAMRSMAKPGATGRIAEIVMQLIEGR